MKYYRVYGATGEYSDHCEWSVFCTPSKDEAEAKANLLNDWLRAQGIFRYGTSPINKKNPHDPQFCNYGGVEYSVEEIDG